SSRKIGSDYLIYNLMNCNKLNAHERDSYINFEPNEHIYSIEDQQYTSVTSFINQFFPKFDSEKWANIKARQLGTTPEALLEEWRIKGEKASQMGTLLHHNIDQHLQGLPHGTEDAFPLFLKFKVEHPRMLPYRTEWAVFDEDSKIAGTIDLLESHGGCYDMYDWKCSTKLIGKNNKILRESFVHETAFAPIQHLDNTSYYHYALQQSLYRYIVEKNYNIQLRSCNLVVLHPSYPNYFVIQLPYLYREIVAMLAGR
ncbi:MAG: hypothetical protein KBD97_05530, partial [Bacteroidaceae bacterium]|nr:hypothetical protein [Bacteroidaceae bacterium]